MKRFDRGMSLLEITVVLAVTAILTTLAVASFGNLREHGEVAGEGHKLLVLLRNARTLSIVTGVRHGVYIGGAADALNNGSSGPDLRNHMAPFRKPGIGDTSNDFNPEQDIILERRVMPQVTTDEGNPLPLLQFRMLRGSPGGSIRIVFNEDGIPTLNLATGGSSSVVPFPNEGTDPHYLILRSTRRNSSDTTFDKDETRRCVSLEPGGEVRMLPRDNCT